MRILILGGSGMIGYNFTNKWKDKYDVFASYRKNRSNYNHLSNYSSKNLYFDIDINKKNIVEELIEDCKPKFVINCIGITKQIINNEDLTEYSYVNSIFPHELKNICLKHAAKLILLSSDCVFSGCDGNYNEYGKSKLLGEVYNHKNTITFRKSTIGLELKSNHGLLEWFLGQDSEIKGYQNAIFSGLTTLELANAIELSMNGFPEMFGLFNIASKPISKYELLSKINYLLGLNISIVPENEFKCDRSLDGSKYNNYTGYNPPSWDNMLINLVNEIKERNDI